MREKGKTSLKGGVNEKKKKEAPIDKKRLESDGAREDNGAHFCLG